MFNRIQLITSILQEPLCNPVDLEEAIRIVKRIMRSPISLTYDPDNLPNLLTTSLKKGNYVICTRTIIMHLCNFVMPICSFIFVARDGW